MYIFYSTHYIKPCSTHAETGPQQIRKRKPRGKITFEGKMQISDLQLNLKCYSQKEFCTHNASKNQLSGLLRNTGQKSVNFCKFCKYKIYHPSRHTMLFQRLYDVYTTSVTSYRRRIDVETTSCVYWDSDCLSKI